MWQNRRWRIRIDVGEVLPVTTILEIDECDLGSRCWRRQLRRLIGEFDAAEAAERVAPPRTEIQRFRHGVAVFTVIDPVNSDLVLTGDDVIHRFLEDLGEHLLPHVLSPRVCIEQFSSARQ